MFLIAKSITRSNKTERFNTHTSYDLTLKADRIDALIYYKQLDAQFLHLETAKDRYEAQRVINLLVDVRKQILKEVEQLNCQDMRVDLYFENKDESTVRNIPHEKIFRYENFLMVFSGLSTKLQIFPELL
mgnify:FL=1